MATHCIGIGKKREDYHRPVEWAVVRSSQIRDWSEATVRSTTLDGYGGATLTASKYQK